jgi:hypothetical protein
MAKLDTNGKQHKFAVGKELLDRIIGVICSSIVTSCCLTK